MDSGSHCARICHLCWSDLLLATEGCSEEGMTPQSVHHLVLCCAAMGQHGCARA